MRTRNQFGVAFPSPLVMLSVIAVAMAGIAFVATSDNPADEQQIQTTAREPDAAIPSKKPIKAKVIKPKVDRATTYVEVYNNSGIKGLAASTAARAGEAGWQVVGTDNWVGAIPAATVYFPPRLKEAGRLLALDLGIRRVEPAIEPMRMDRLTVILVG